MLKPSALVLLGCLLTYYWSESDPEVVPRLTPLQDLADSYDFVIVGAGSAGSVLGSRLTEQAWRVVVLEAGDAENLISRTPFLAPQLWNSDKDWNYTTLPQHNACRRDNGRCMYQRGRSVGGSSAINFMAYVRGNKVDFDNWGKAGNPGWDYKNMLPYFKKSEDLRVQELHDHNYRSTGGYLTVDYPQEKTELREAYIKAGKELGYQQVDYNGASQTGVAYTQFTIRGGKRCSVATAFLTPAASRSNLHVVPRVQVQRILWKDDRAIGVELEGGRRVLATKEVILSAGAINTPVLLLRSGVGPEQQLKQRGIPVVADLPVGQNLQDHAILEMSFELNRTAGFHLDSGDVQAMTVYAKDGKGPLSSPLAVEAIGFFSLKETPSEPPDVQVVFRSLDTDGKGRGVAIAVTKSRPVSRGSIRLGTGGTVDIDPGLLRDPADLEDQVAACRLVLRLANTSALAPWAPVLRTGACPSTDPCPCLVPLNTASMWHPCGTAPLGLVLNQDLTVQKLRSLRVVDASVFPAITSGNINAPIIALAEKAADIILQHYKTQT